MRIRSVKKALSFAGLLLACLMSVAQAAPQTQELASGSALLVDLKTNQVLYSSNPDLQVPIASVTKLMTAMVVLDAKQPLDQQLDIMIKDVAEMRGVYSRVRLGSQLSRRDMLLLTLMSSENRAAASLAHHYPGGVPAFVAAMNAKAQALGLKETRFVDPTGLSEANVSSARDLAELVRAAYSYPTIREFTTSDEAIITSKGRPIAFHNSNRLVRSPNWEIGLSKTGFISEAGRCLVMQAWVAQRSVVIVLLDSVGKLTHFDDANRVRTWLEGTLPGAQLRH